MLMLQIPCNKQAFCGDSSAGRAGDLWGWDWWAEPQGSLSLCMHCDICMRQAWCVSVSCVCHGRTGTRDIQPFVAPGMCLGLLDLSGWADDRVLFSRTWWGFECLIRKGWSKHAARNPQNVTGIGWPAPSGVCWQGFVNSLINPCPLVTQNFIIE